MVVKSCSGGSDVKLSRGNLFLASTQQKRAGHVSFVVEGDSEKLLKAISKMDRL